MIWLTISRNVHALKSISSDSSPNGFVCTRFFFKFRALLSSSSSLLGKLKSFKKSSFLVCCTSARRILRFLLLCEVVFVLAFFERFLSSGSILSYLVRNILYCVSNFSADTSCIDLNLHFWNKFWHLKFLLIILISFQILVWFFLQLFFVHLLHFEVQTWERQRFRCRLRRVIVKRLLNFRRPRNDNQLGLFFAFLHDLMLP